VHVWRADLDAVPDDLLELLDGEERGRAARVQDDLTRRQWSRAHAVLRALLGRYLQIDPRALRFATEAHGRPVLLRAQWPSFNLSHSRGLALYAFAGGPSVGIDVELAGRSIDYAAVASRAFGAAEAHRLRELGPDARERRFLREWTRYEAMRKLWGAGIGVPPTDPRGAPWIAELVMGARCAASVALQQPPTRLSCWAWRG
jgi:4'-phosphopantetheinyl transferase